MVQTILNHKNDWEWFRKTTYLCLVYSTYLLVTGGWISGIVLTTLWDLWILDDQKIRWWFSRLFGDGMEAFFGLMNVDIKMWKFWKWSSEDLGWSAVPNSEGIWIGIGVLLSRYSQTCDIQKKIKHGIIIETSLRIIHIDVANPAHLEIIFLGKPIGFLHLCQLGECMDDQPDGGIDSNKTHSKWLAIPI